MVSNIEDYRIGLNILTLFNGKTAFYIVFKEWKFWIHSIFPLVMCRVSGNVTSAIDRFLKSLTDFFHIVLGTGMVLVVLFTQESLVSGYCRFHCHDYCVN